MTEPVLIMLDLETLGSNPGDALVSIGACVFTEAGDITDEFYVEIKQSSNREFGFTVDPTTVSWWAQQEDAVRSALIEGPETVHVKTALKNFTTWLKQYQKPQLWALPASFDCTMLRAAYQIVGLKCPYHFTQEMCARTLLRTVPPNKVTRDGTHHNALADAKFQAEKLCTSLRKLRKR